MVFAFFLWLILSTQALASQDAPLVALNTSGQTPVAANFVIFWDETGRLTIQDIVQKDREQQFVPISASSLNAGYTEDHAWIKLIVDNPTAEDIWYLTAEYPNVDMQVFLMNPSEPNAIALAPTRAYNLAATRLNVPSGTRATLYLHVHTMFVLDLQFKLMNEKQLTERNYSRIIFASVVAGCFLAMIIYNLFLYLSLRDRNYLFYLLFAVVNSHLNLLSIAFPQSINTWLGWNWLSFATFIVPLAPMTAFLFARSFLQTRIHAPKLDRILLLYMAGLIVLMVVSLMTSRPLSWRLQNPYFLCGVILLLFAGCYSLKKGFAPAAYYLAGTGAFLLGMFIFLCKSASFIPSHPLTDHAHLIGQALEMVLMSLALGGRIKLLETAKTRAEVTAQVKSRLLRIISHDIATPLMVVKVTAYYLKKETPENMKLDKISRAAEIIEDIVGFIRKTETIESGDQLELGPVPLARVFENLAFLFLDRATDKGIQLTFDLEQPNMTVWAESVSLSNEVLGNLISNAIKFSFPGAEIKVRAAFRRDGKVMISVQDRGVGMDLQILADLFDLTKKQSRPGTQGEKGIGFGMPLAQTYVHAYGGVIEAESIPMEKDTQTCGTTLRIILESAAA
ncbi:MAG TPA: sensor histidine kinase [Oligoflexus sp.]|nr:sensor histidine kinase [Oligoflexus sp.]